MTHQIAFRFEDGVTRFITANAGETVADAAYRQGVNIPLDCRDGACGTCKCRAESGRFEMGEYIEDALSEDEAAQGFVLTCQMRAQSDCVVAVPASSAVCRTPQAAVQASVQSVRQLSPSTIALTLQAPALDKLAFLPGQYVNLQLPGSTETRAYSFSSLVNDGTVSFLIRNVPGGRMSGWLTGAAQPGDAMTLTGPLGTFYLRDIRRPLLLLAGGTGLAPFTAMLEKIARDGGSPHPIHLVYGVTLARKKVLFEIGLGQADGCNSAIFNACDPDRLRAPRNMRYQSQAMVLAHSIFGPDLAPSGASAATLSTGQP